MGTACHDSTVSRRWLSFFVASIERIPKYWIVEENQKKRTNSGWLLKPRKASASIAWKSSSSLGLCHSNWNLYKWRLFFSLIYLLLTFVVFFFFLLIGTTSVMYLKKKMLRSRRVQTADCRSSTNKEEHWENQPQRQLETLQPEAGWASSRQSSYTARIVIGCQVNDGFLVTGDRVLARGAAAQNHRNWMPDGKCFQVPAFQPVAQPAVVTRAGPLITFQQQTACKTKNQTQSPITWTLVQSIVLGWKLSRVVFRTVSQW